MGDEIVISWPLKVGLSNANCVRCFFAMRQALEHRRNYFQSRFGLFPQFKAALHAGEVTTGEIGALKKEITFSGDVLNVTSRIQGLCNQFQSDLLISGSLFERLALPDQFGVDDLGEHYLKGRDEPVALYSIQLSDLAAEKTQKT